MHFSNSPFVKTTIITCSLHPESKSRLMAQALLETWPDDDSQPAQMVDLRDYALPLCDGGSAYAAPDTQKLGAILTECDAAIFAVPIYNYDINAAAKNAIELVGRNLEHKVAGFLCAAGGQRSYMSVMAVANSLMLDFRTVIVPRFVYAGGDDFEEGDDPLTPAIRDRILRFGEEFRKLAQAVTSIRNAE